MLTSLCLILTASEIFGVTWSQEVNDTATSVTVQDNIQILQVGMCIPKNDPSGIKDDFCKCDRNVVSCDFTKFQSKDKTTVELRAFFKEDTINRICICNSPKNLQVVVADHFIQNYFNVARVDFYNLNGPLIIDGAFRVFFAGDIYMSKVKLLRAMFGWEYGRGNDRERGSTPLKRDPTVLQCCSAIKTPKFSAPTFYMEDSTVHTIRSGALNSEHLWANILFNGVTFYEMNTAGIVLNGQAENASFTNSHFHRLNKTAILTQDFSNLIFAHNTFHSTCDKMPLGLRSPGSTSVLALIQNRFDLPVALEVDAQQIAIWFNSFSTWDANTFGHLNGTSHGSRQVSIEFNTVDRFDLQLNDISPFESYDTKVIFQENVIGPCDCMSIDKLNLPMILRNYTQRCYSESGGRKTPCHLKMVDVKQDCMNTLGKPNYVKLCEKDETNFIPFYSNTVKEIEPFLNKVSARIKSPFVNDRLRQVKSPFGGSMTDGKIPKSASNNSFNQLHFHIMMVFGIAYFVLK